MEEETTQHAAGGGKKKPPLILYLKRNSLDDGPGIRTTVFFKGCPLDCVWCHNPESKSRGAELSFDPEKCIGCRTCIYACKRKAIDRDFQGYIDRSRCNLCFKCAEECPSQAMSRMGAPAEIDEIMAVVRKDIPFYKTSGGGVTLSGGEPTLYMSFCSTLLKDCKNEGINTLLETCGAFDFSRFRAELLPWLDTIYFDIKLIDPEDHKKYCGVGNERILENFRRLNEAARAGGFNVLPRVPLVPGITAMDKNLSLVAAFLRGCGADTVTLLPYNPTWIRKASMLGKPNKYDGSSWMTTDEIARCHSLFDSLRIT